MGNGWSSSSPFRTDHEGSTKVSIEKQRVTDFSGRADEWPKWKQRTLCVLATCKHDRIVTDSDYASAHPEADKLIFSLLANATVDGTAYHLVKDHEDDKSGHEAWASLCEWFDGEEIREETADDLRSKINNLKLDSGTSASVYINNFKMWMADLDMTSS